MSHTFIYSSTYFLQNVKDLPDYLEFKPMVATPLNQIFTAAGDDLLHLLQSMLKLDPLRRCSATQVGLANKSVLLAVMVLA